MADLELALDRGEAGILDRFKEHRERKVLEHLEDYLPVFRGRVTHKGYARGTEQILRRMLAACRVHVLGDLTAEKIDRYLAKLEVAANTKKKHFFAMSGFVKWLYQHNRIEDNFMWRLESPRGGVESKIRSLDIKELQRLLQVTRERPLREAMLVRRGPRKGECVANVGDEVKATLEQEGRGRHALYRLAMLTALRKDEIARLRVGNLDFEHKPFPVVHLPAEITKGKSEATLWLSPSLAEELQQWVQETGRTSADTLFRVPDKLNRIFRRDLKMAEIDLNTEKGVARFRSLRKSANVLLRQEGIDPAVRKLFMRHSDIRLTTDTYDDGRLDDMKHLLPVLEKLAVEMTSGGKPKPAC
jgi:integrase